LLDYGQRYADIVRPTKLTFRLPNDVADFDIVERLEGNATTDFGAPDAAPAYDDEPFTEADLDRCETLLPAYWAAFDTAVQAATDKELRKGPRGGGRDLTKITEHVLGSQASYLRQLAWKHKVDEEADPHDELKRILPAILEALAASARGDLPKEGPRGGKLWSPRYFIRRSVWHLLDHAWEIEDRIT
jgi:hypothetical protein